MTKSFRIIEPKHQPSTAQPAWHRMGVPSPLSFCWQGTALALSCSALLARRDFPAASPEMCRISSTFHSDTCNRVTASKPKLHIPPGLCPQSRDPQRLPPLVRACWMVPALRSSPAGVCAATAGPCGSRVWCLLPEGRAVAARGVRAPGGSGAPAALTHPRGAGSRNHGTSSER